MNPKWDCVKENHLESFFFHRPSISARHSYQFTQGCSFSISFLLRERGSWPKQRACSLWDQAYITADKNPSSSKSPQTKMKLYAISIKWYILTSERRQLRGGIVSKKGRRQKSSKRCSWKTRLNQWEKECLHSYRLQGIYSDESRNHPRHPLMFLAQGACGPFHNATVTLMK